MSRVVLPTQTFDRVGRWGLLHREPRVPVVPGPRGPL